MITKNTHKLRKEAASPGVRFGKVKSKIVFSLGSNPYRSIGDESTNHEATVLLLIS